MLTGIELISKERAEQIEKHGRTIEKDVRDNGDYQLLQGAEQLLWLSYTKMQPSECCPFDWTPEIWAKMYNKPYKERLIIAGALLAAEIDRQIALGR